MLEKMTEFWNHSIEDALQNQLCYLYILNDAKSSSMQIGSDSLQRLFDRWSNWEEQTSLTVKGYETIKMRHIDTAMNYKVLQANKCKWQFQNTAGLE